MSAINLQVSNKTENWRAPSHNSAIFRRLAVIKFKLMWIISNISIKSRDTLEVQSGVCVRPARNSTTRETNEIQSPGDAAQKYVHNHFRIKIRFNGIVFVFIYSIICFHLTIINTRYVCDIFSTFLPFSPLGCVRSIDEYSSRTTTRKIPFIGIVRMQWKKCLNASRKKKTITVIMAFRCVAWFLRLKHSYVRHLRIYGLFQLFL